MFYRIYIFKKSWFLLLNYVTIIALAWSGDVTLKDIGEKEFMRIKGNVKKFR